MKFEPIRLSSISQQKFSLKKIFSNGRMKIRTLLADVFEKNSKPEILVSRGLPNAVGAEDEVYNATFSRFEFYPEDIVKMANLTEEECIDYRMKLISKKRYIEYPDD